ncbi:MAG: HD domain-containing protein [Candidatus Pacebacteria bacterium]|nr:HD domain-containing protein [Candidatus Paceibacterota bacterium]
MMKIPKEVIEIIGKLEKKKFQAFIVGGCVRDYLQNITPNDWDIATSAIPEEISKIFPKNYTDNTFGTVRVLTKSKEENLKEIEITTFRTEEKYTDKRHPDKVSWAETIEADLSRRDFTINAIALRLKDDKWEIIDPFSGQKDLKAKTIKAVGNPDQRFKEDALRLMRAIRLAAALGFTIENKTYKAVKDNSSSLKHVSQERIRDEFTKLIMSKNPSLGIELLRETDLLRYVVPELLEGYKIGQNKHHLYDVYDHSLRSLDYAAQKGYNKYVRMSALLHDIAKPRTKAGQGKDSTFYGHEIIGAKMTKQILSRLRFSNKEIEKITKLVRYHLFYYDAQEVTESSVRRLLLNVGKENLEELVQLRTCDRIGSGCPKAMPYKLRHFLYIVEKVSQDPINSSNLKIDGKDIMGILKTSPGPRIGWILNILLSDVLNDPEDNNKKYLESKTKELGQLDEQKLEKLSRIAKEKIGQVVGKRDEMTKQKYWVS